MCHSKTAYLTEEKAPYLRKIETIAAANALIWPAIR